MLVAFYLKFVSLSLSLSSQKSVEVAVKVVRKDLFRQDPKAEQNLMREIDILKKLRQCEYVVHLYHVQVS